VINLQDIVVSNFGTALEARQALALQGTSPVTDDPPPESPAAAAAASSETSDGRQATGHSNAKQKAALRPDSPETVPEKSEYELEKERNIAQNKLLLKELGLNSKFPPPKPRHSVNPRSVKKTHDPDPSHVDKDEQGPTATINEDEPTATINEDEPTATINEDEPTATVNEDGQGPTAEQVETESVEKAINEDEEAVTATVNEDGQGPTTEQVEKESVGKATATVNEDGQGPTTEQVEKESVGKAMVVYFTLICYNTLTLDVGQKQVTDVAGSRHQIPQGGVNKSEMGCVGREVCHV